MRCYPRCTFWVQFGGGKKTASEFLLEENSFSASGAMLKDACSTCGDSAFHTDVLPARFVNIGLPKYKEADRVRSFFWEDGDQTMSS